MYFFKFFKLNNSIKQNKKLFTLKREFYHTRGEEYLPNF